MFVVSTGGCEPATCAADAPTSVMGDCEFTERVVSTLTPVVTTAMVLARSDCGLGVKQVTEGTGALCSITGERVTSSIGGAGVAK